MRGITMSENIAAKGGCIWIVSSEFDAFNSNFINNKALQGGVIFAIQKTFFAVKSS